MFSWIFTCVFLVKNVLVRVRCVKRVAFRNFASVFVLFSLRRLFLCLTENEKTEYLPSPITIRFGSNPGREQIGVAYIMVLLSLSIENKSFMIVLAYFFNRLFCEWTIDWHRLIPRW
jgi:hypothetical protein